MALHPAKTSHKRKGTGHKGGIGKHVSRVAKTGRKGKQFGKAISKGARSR